MLLVGDLGYGVVEGFSEEFPHLFLNAGVAEQNMTGMAAGIAAEGTRVFTYSIANFPTMRALEQIRNDICYHSFPVTIVSVGSGVDYGTLGYSHFAVEDISVMRPLPRLVVYCPADEAELVVALDAIFSSTAPSFVRLPKDNQAPLPMIGTWTDAKYPRKLLTGESELLVLTTGSIAMNVVRACAQLSEEFPGGVAVYSVPQISPLGLEGVNWHRYRRVLTIEEHVLPGGFGSAVLEYFSDCDIRLPVTRVGIELPEDLPVGSKEYLRARSGLDEASIAARIRKEVFELRG